MHFYILLTEQFCLANCEHVRDGLKFGYAVTIDGRYVTSVNTLNELPELFEGLALSVLPIPRSDFPIKVRVVPAPEEVTETPPEEAPQTLE